VNCTPLLSHAAQPSHPAARLIAARSRTPLGTKSELGLNTKTSAALQRASKQATTAKTAAQAKANNLQVKIEASIKLRGASGPQQLNTLEAKVGATC
jgi:hypothetical protein